MPTRPLFRRAATLLGAFAIALSMGVAARADEALDEKIRELDQYVSYANTTNSTGNKPVFIDQMDAAKKIIEGASPEMKAHPRFKGLLDTYNQLTEPYMAAKAAGAFEVVERKMGNAVPCFKEKVNQCGGEYLEEEIRRVKEAGLPGSTKVPFKVMDKEMTLDELHAWSKEVIAQDTAILNKSNQGGNKAHDAIAEFKKALKGDAKAIVDKQGLPQWSDWKTGGPTKLIMRYTKPGPNGRMVDTVYTFDRKTFKLLNTTKQEK